MATATFTIGDKEYKRTYRPRGEALQGRGPLARGDARPRHLDEALARTKGEAAKTKRGI